MPKDAPRYRCPAGRHRHKCPKCGCVWEHANTCIDLPCPLHTEAHSCPKCHTESDATYDHYHGRAEPSVRNHHEK